jgi:thiol-disulfide isomerase/thioredoxin
MRSAFVGSLAAALVALAPASAFASPSLSAVLAANDWLNGRLTKADVNGKVVLLDFYTFDCINCKHVEPNLRELYRTRSRADLVVVSVHSPETPYERDRANLIASLKEQGVAWPVAVDNDYALWNAYGVSAWPTQLIFDRGGALRQTVVGEGQDGLVDDTIDALIAH